MNDTDKQIPGRKSTRRFMFVFFGVVLTIIAIFILTILIFAGNDLTRDVPTPALAQKVLMQQNGFNHTRISPAASVRQTSTTFAQSPPDLLPFISDSAEIPEAIRKRRKELNGAFLKLNAALESYRRDKFPKSKFTGSSEFEVRWQGILVDYSKATTPFFKAWDESGTKGMQSRHELIPSSECELISAKSMKIQTELMSDLEEAWIRYNDFQKIANAREIQGNWDEAVYYWRRSGVRGHCRIIAGSIARRFAINSKTAILANFLPYRGPETNPELRGKRRRN